MSLPSKSPPIPPTSRIYVLRLWKEGEDGRVWRASLHEGAGTARRYFATLDGLIEHLFGEMTRTEATAAPPCPHEKAEPHTGPCSLCPPARC